MRLRKRHYVKHSLNGSKSLPSAFIVPLAPNAHVFTRELERPNFESIHSLLKKGALMYIGGNHCMEVDDDVQVHQLHTIKKVKGVVQLCVRQFR